MIKFPDYDRSILSIASSVLNYFGVTDCKHKTLPELDELLNKNYKNVIVMLFDGMGTSVLENHLKEDDFLRQHHIADISSVFPSTTVASLTAIESGYSPLETGWLGWDLYFDEIGENVTTFHNTLQRNGEPAAEYNVPQQYIPHKSIFQRIEEVKGKKTAYYVSAFSKYHSKSVPDICKTVYRISKKRKQKYIYTYWHQPDSMMHEYGVDSLQAKNEVELIDQEVQKLCKKLKNSLVIITADHGQINCINEYLEDYSSLTDMLKIPPSIEPRAVSFFVKDGKNKDFQKEFNKIFGEAFRLMSKEEAFSEHLFGYGKPHHKTKDFVGDFLAVATSNVILNSNRSDFEAIGGHAGLTTEEMTVPFIAFEVK